MSIAGDSIITLRVIPSYHKKLAKNIDKNIKNNELVLT